MKQSKGITLIALVITIIVLLILAGVTINLTLGDNGIFKVAEQAARNYKDAENKELGLLEKFDIELGTNFEYNASKGVNKPKLLDGMTPIKFNFNAEKNEYEESDTSEKDDNWYNYYNKQWANTQTEDGSMWVWIPRYAYKITYTDAADKSKGGAIEVVFLLGKTDNYYDADGNLQTAKRAISADEVVDTTTNYTVHPAFTDESSINYANGGWDEELTGIWVAKFEAGYASGNNEAQVKSSSVNYSQIATNFFDEDDGSQIISIKYPTFQGITFAMNYISINDAYNISRALTEKGNIYGMNSSNADSHLMKNSEWGAVAYLSQSKFGLNGNDIQINNANLNSTARNVYAVTGCCSLTENAEAVETTVDELNARTETDIYVWCQENGQAASSTGTVYGIYDMSGGTWERTAGYVANGHNHLKKYGESLAYNGDSMKTTSTKYVTVYPHDKTVDYTGTTASIDLSTTANYAMNTKIYGDAIRETSTSGLGTNSWYSNNSYFWRYSDPFSVRGGIYNNGSIAGVTAFARTSGYQSSSYGFRAVLVAK